MATRMGFLGAPEQFDPSSDDWTLYSERFEHFVKANDITDEQKLHLLLVAMSDRKWGVVRNVYVFVLLRVRDQLVAAKE